MLTRVTLRFLGHPRASYGPCTGEASSRARCGARRREGVNMASFPWLSSSPVFLHPHFVFCFGILYHHPSSLSRFSLQPPSVHPKRLVLLSSFQWHVIVSMLFYFHLVFLSFLRTPVWLQVLTCTETEKFSAISKKKYCTCCRT